MNHKKDFSFFLGWLGARFAIFLVLSLFMNSLVKSNFDNFHEQLHRKRFRGKIQFYVNKIAVNANLSRY